MRRTRIFSAAVAALLSLSAAIPALASPPPPHGMLTGTEYNELLATQQAVNRRGQSGTVTGIARRDCSRLNGVSRLTSTQHAECVAALLFFYHFAQFTPELARCQKKPVGSRQVRCTLRASNDLYRFTQGFIRTNVASNSAVRARGLTGQCFDYLVFTTPQARAMHSLIAGLLSFMRAVRSGNPAAPARAGRRLEQDVTLTGTAFDTTGTVAVCPHR